MVDPHGVPWPAFRSALPGSHCWSRWLLLPLGVAGATQGLYHPPTPALGKHQRTSTQKMGLAQKHLESYVCHTRISSNNDQGKFVNRHKLSFQKLQENRKSWEGIYTYGSVSLFLGLNLDYFPFYFLPSPSRTRVSPI